VDRDDWDQLQDDIGDRMADRDRLYGAMRPPTEGAWLDIDDACYQLGKDVKVIAAAPESVRSLWAPTFEAAAYAARHGRVA
jgi:hypothetical protein